MALPSRLARCRGRRPGYIRAGLWTILLLQLFLPARRSWAQSHAERLAYPNEAGSSRSGSVGLWRVESALPMQVGKLRLAVTSEFFITRALITPTDTNLFNSERLLVRWAPVAHLDLGLSLNITNDNYTDFVSHTLQGVGSPVLAARYVGNLLPGLDVGGLLSLSAPSNPTSGLPQPGALAVTGQALGTWQPRLWLQVHVNLGMTWDRSRFLVPHQLAPEERLVLDVYDFSRAVAGLGLMGRINLAERLLLRPFVELEGYAGRHLAVRTIPGVKFFIGNLSLLEFGMGAELRVLGRPAQTVGAPAEPPWRAFLAVTVHAFDRAVLSEPPIRLERVCRTDSDCEGGQSCGSKGICVAVVLQVAPALVLVTLKGEVRDASDAALIPEAEIRVQGASSSILLARDGTFATWELPVQAGKSLTLEASAAGYAPQQLNLALDALAKGNLLFQLQRRPEPPAQLSGTVHSVRFGRPIPGAQVFLPKSGQRLPVAADGTFAAAVPSGKFDILISAPGHLTQRRRLVLSSKETVVLHLALVPARRKLSRESERLLGQ